MTRSTVPGPDAQRAATDSDGPPIADRGHVATAPELYLDLLKNCLTRYLFIDEETKPATGLGWRRKAYEPVASLLQRFDVTLTRRGGDREARSYGRDWPQHAETMVGLRRLDNLQQCVEDVLRRGVPGDLIETGVWRGGTTIFMRGILAAYGDGDRKVWVADSFEGLPPPNAADYPADKGLDLRFPELSIGLDEVKRNFERYGLLDDRVEFLRGWFKDTLPTAPIDRLAVMRLDGDLYESTMDAITALYPKLSVGGYVIVDDYRSIRACAQAISDYRSAHGIEDPIEVVDWTGVYWRKTGASQA